MRPINLLEPICKASGYKHIHDLSEFNETSDYQKKNYETAKKKLLRALEFL